MPMILLFRLTPLASIIVTSASLQQNCAIYYWLYFIILWFLYATRIPVQPQAIVQLIEILQTISITAAGLHSVQQSFQFGKGKRQQLFVAQRSQMGARLRVVRLNDVVDANGGRRIAEIDAAAEIADRSTAVDRRGRYESTDFGAAIGVNVVGPFQANVEILCACE